MIFAILFVIAFAIGLVTYKVTGKWLSAAFISIALFVLNTISDTDQIDKAFYTILLGLPVVFSASLFGAYVVELRRGTGNDDVLEQHDKAIDSSNENSVDEDPEEKAKNVDK